MDTIEKLRALSAKLEQQASLLQTEEATKTALILPFIHGVLGYDIFDPSEVIPEFIADVGSKKGEKVDYAISNKGQVQILIECKKYNETLNIKHASQLYRYFSVTNARIAILTNGSLYQLYTDLDAQNKMDSIPFLEINLCDLDESIVPELTKLTKRGFDLDSVLNAAAELRYVSSIKKIFASQLEKPDEDFIRVFASRIHEGILTKTVKEQFSNLTKKALSRFVNDRVNDAIKGALKNINASSNNLATMNNGIIEENDAKKYATTTEELEAFYIIKSIARQIIDINRISHRDTQSYFGILVDDNNRKPVCRLHFNRSQKHIGLFDLQKKEMRYPINSLDEIYGFSEQIKDAIKSYFMQN